MDAKIKSTDSSKLVLRFGILHTTFSEISKDVSHFIENRVIVRNYKKYFTVLDLEIYTSNIENCLDEVRSKTDKTHIILTATN